MTTEQKPLTPERVRALGSRIKSILELVGSPAGVRLLFDETKKPAGAHALTHHRYCEAVMKAAADGGYHGAVVPDCAAVHDSPEAFHSRFQHVRLNVRGIKTKRDVT